MTFSSSLLIFGKRGQISYLEAVCVRGGWWWSGGFFVILRGNLHISVFHPFLLGWWYFPEKTLPMSWLEGIILASSIPGVEKREKAEMSQILGHKLLLNPPVFSGRSLPPSAVPGVPESRDPLFYYLLLHRVEKEIWRCFLNRLSNSLSILSPTIIFSPPTPPFPQLSGANFWASGLLPCKVGYLPALPTASFGLAFLDPLIHLPLFHLLCSIWNFTAIVFFPVIIMGLCFYKNPFTLIFIAFSSEREYLFNQPSLLRISI